MSTHENIKITMARIINEYYFPISILQGFLDNPNKALQDALNYALVEYARANNIDDAEVAKTFGVIMGNSIADKAKRHKATNRKQPHTHIGRNAFWSMERRTDSNHPSEPPTETELITLLAKLGLYSISGHKRDKEVQTTKAQLFARMQGYPSYKDVPAEDARITRWQTRKHFARLKKLVQDISRIEFKDGHQRGITFVVHVDTDNDEEADDMPF